MSIEERLAKIEALIKEHKAVHASEQRAIDIAANEVNRRLEGMNEFRDQLQNQAATFATKDAIEAMTVERLRIFAQIEERVRHLENQTSNLHGRIWMMGAVVTTVALLVNIFIQIFLS